MLSYWSKCELWFENLWLIDSTLNHCLGANHSQTLKHVTHLICNVIYNSWNNTAVAMMNRIKIYFLQNWNPMSIIWLSSKRKKKRCLVISMSDTFFLILELKKENGRNIWNLTPWQLISWDLPLLVSSAASASPIIQF